MWRAMINAYSQRGLDGIADLSQFTFGELPEEAMAQIREAVMLMTRATPVHDS